MKRLMFAFAGFVLLLAAVLPSSAVDSGNVSKLIVQGDGKANAAPDMATIVLGVETHNASAAGAAAENARLMNSTVAALLKAGIKEKDIQTSTYSLTTQQEVPTAAGEKPKPPEFVATNQVTVQLNDTSGVGKVLDAAVSAGSNSIQSISFGLRDPSPERDIALTMAIGDAKRKAMVAAAAAGVKLGRVLEVSENYGFVSPAASRAVAFNVATPIQPGEMEVSASVTLTYEIS
jgi:uncharacterized protein YggE